MPDLNKATSTSRAKRGYRKVTMTLRLDDYNYLAKIADAESRTPDQQAAYMLRLALQDHDTQALEQEDMDTVAAKEAYDPGPNYSPTEIEPAPDRRMPSPAPTTG